MRNQLRWNRFFGLGLAVVLAAGLAGCLGADEDSGGSSDSGSGLSCSTTFESFDVCTDYVGTAYTEAIVSEACATDQLVFAASSCSDAMADKTLVGCCKSDIGQPTENHVCYYGDSSGAAALESSCSAGGGTWE